MDTVLISIIGEDDDAKEVLFKGFKEFSAKKVILLVKEGYEEHSKKIIKGLSLLHVNFEEKPFPENPQLEDVFLSIKEISEMYKDSQIVLNVDTDYYTSCLALSSAFVNGITAIGMLKDEIIVYPVMKFSYYHALNKKKMELLEIIAKEKCVESMEKLSQLANMSLPLIAYHLKGNRDSRGLEELNLVELKREKGSLKISLTPLGNLIVKGGISCKK
jgi:hypothetical protein